MNFTGIRWKLAATYFTIIIGTLFLLNWFIIGFLEKDYFKAREATYLAHANVIAGTAQDYLYRRDRNARLLAQDFGTQVKARVLLLDREGGVFVDSFNEPWLEEQKLTYKEVESALSGKGSAARIHQLQQDQWALYVAVPVTREKEIIGAVMLSTDVNDIYQSLSLIRAKLIVFSLTGASAALLVSLWLAGALTKPVKELTRAAENMAAGDLHQRVKVKGNDEISQLGSAFNTLSERLEKVDRARTDFITNASHELKSPLGSMKALAESMIFSMEDGVETYKEVLRDIDNEIDRLGKLVQELLYLMRLEEEGETLLREEISVGEIIEEVVSRLSAKARLNRVTLTYEADNTLNWLLDRELSVRILYNLVDNAINYSPASAGKVHVRGKAAGQELVLQVCDNGEGIPEEDLLNIFDRFYRVDKARARETGGTGLGLSIVQQGVKLHGGRITVKSKRGTGSIFTITLPKNLKNV